MSAGRRGARGKRSGDRSPERGKRGKGEAFPGGAAGAQRTGRWGAEGIQRFLGRRAPILASPRRGVKQPGLGGSPMAVGGSEASWGPRRGRYGRSVCQGAGSTERHVGGPETTVPLAGRSWCPSWSRGGVLPERGTEAPRTAGLTLGRRGRGVTESSKCPALPPPAAVSWQVPHGLPGRRMSACARLRAHTVSAENRSTRRAWPLQQSQKY